MNEFIHVIAGKSFWKRWPCDPCLTGRINVLQCFIRYTPTGIHCSNSHWSIVQLLRQRAPLNTSRRRKYPHQPSAWIPAQRDEDVTGRDPLTTLQAQCVGVSLPVQRLEPLHRSYSTQQDVSSSTNWVSLSAVLGQNRNNLRCSGKASPSVPQEQ